MSKKDLWNIIGSILGGAYSHGPLPVIGTYNPMYGMDNPKEITAYN